MTVSIVALKSEITVDPLLRGYDGFTDLQVVDSLNDTIDRDQNRETMTSSEVFNAIDKTEFNALTDIQRDLIWNILAMGVINPFGLEQDLFVDTFGASTTITNLADARKSVVSRAVELGFGVVKLGHVQEARA